MSSSDGASKGSVYKLITSVQHSVPPGMICLALPRLVGRRDVVEPLAVRWSWPQASFTLAFDMLTKDRQGHYNLDVAVRDLVAPRRDGRDAQLQILANFEWYKRSPNADVSSETDRAKWPRPEPSMRVLASSPGRIGSFPYRTLRALTVHLQVYAVGDAHGGDLPAGLNALRLDKTLADVELKVGGEDFPAHRAVLAARSPVFRCMFTCDLKESREGVVKIDGTSATAFGVFLEFLYTASVGNWKDCEVELLELAELYMVPSLKAVCEERLLSHPRLSLAVLQNAAKPVVSGDLRMRAVRVVTNNWDAVSGTPQWERFQAACPVGADSIRMAQETLPSAPK